MTAAAPAPLLLVRRDPARRMHRFYALRIAPDLLGGWALLREWGRVASPGRVRSDSFADEAGARAALERLARRKRGRGTRKGRNGRQRGT